MFSESGHEKELPFLDPIWYAARAAVTKNCFCHEFIVDFFSLKVPETDLACGLLPIFRSELVMKYDDHNDVDQNWRWPQKTWFQERLKAVKAREAEQKREDSPPEGVKPARRQAGKTRERP